MWDFKIDTVGASTNLGRVEFQWPDLKFGVEGQPFWKSCESDNSRRKSPGIFTCIPYVHLLGCSFMFFFLNSCVVVGFRFIVAKIIPGIQTKLCWCLACGCVCRMLRETPAWCHIFSCFLLCFLSVCELSTPVTPAEDLAHSLVPLCVLQPSQRQGQHNRALPLPASVSHCIISYITEQSSF